jgi:hypothetical protein
LLVLTALLLHKLLRLLLALAVYASLTMLL